MNNQEDLQSTVTANHDVESELISDHFSLQEPSEDPQQVSSARRLVTVGGSDPSKSSHPGSIPGLFLDVNRFDQEWEEAKGRYVPRKAQSDSKDEEPNDHNKCAFSIVRLFKPSNLPSVHNVTTELHVWSPYFVQVAEIVMKEVKSVSWRSKPLKAPPELFLSFMHDFQRYLDDLEKKPLRGYSDALIIEHLDFFIGFMKMEYQKTLRDLKELLKQDQITFDLLWAIYRPGTVLYTKSRSTGEPMAVKLHESFSIQEGSLYTLYFLLPLY
jgi:hypothetical protein